MVIFYYLSSDFTLKCPSDRGLSAVIFDLRTSYEQPDICQLIKYL